MGICMYELVAVRTKAGQIILNLFILFYGSAGISCG